MSSTFTPVSRLERVPLREIWPHEERDFTTWLAANLDVLSGHLEHDIVSGETERAAGEFRVDVDVSRRNRRM